MNQTPEQKARSQIDKMLNQAGWVIQDKNKVNLSLSFGIAIREYQTDAGPADYVLFVDRKAVGVIEAKREEEGHRLTPVEEQSGGYAKAKLKWVNNKDPLPFVYESTGAITHFTDLRDPKPRSREVFTFFRPETLSEWIKQGKSLRERLTELPLLGDVEDNFTLDQAEIIAKNLLLRTCQFTAIHKLENSFRNNRPRSLIQMATGAGKTYTAISSVYRLLKPPIKAKRILFLVDTKNLGEQAEQEFMSYTPIDDNRKFTELYNVQRLSSSNISKDSHVCISTIQRMYSILKGEEMEEKAEEENPHERWQAKEPVPVAYNPKVPIEFFDFIIIDECHRSIYNLWRQVVDYFDAFLIGLTATPDKRTFGFFNENVVSEYSHEEAVADGVNVPYEIFTIETKVTRKGALIEAQKLVEKRERLTRRKRWEQLDEDTEYSKKELDREVVNPSQIRTIIRAFRDNLPIIFPGRKEVPKTLIFAKTDSHAEDIIPIIREEFDESNEFCKKLTYKAEEDPKSVLAQFRNDFNPRIAVTVDMIATGTDVKPLECLVFFRDVKSRNYFEQMKGRGTRTVDFEKLKKVTPSAISAKTHFIIVDTIGVTKSLKTDSRPFERKPTISLKDLMTGIMMGATDDDLCSSLAGRFAIINKQFTDDEKNQLKDFSGGKTITEIIHLLLNANDPDLLNTKVENILEKATDISKEEAVQKAKDELNKDVAECFNGELIEFILDTKRQHEQIIDIDNLDTVEFAGWDEHARENCEALIRDFKEFLTEHKDEITALTILYNEPQRRKEITYAMIKDLLDVMKRKKPILAPVRVWDAFERLDKTKSKAPKNELIALVSLVRHVTDIDEQLTPFNETVNKNFKNWVFQKNAGHVQFTAEQMRWLRMIKDHISTSIHFENTDLDYAPFDAKGGIGKIYEVFGEGINDIVVELNETLVA